MNVLELVNGSLGEPLGCTCCENASGSFFCAVGPQAYDALPAAIGRDFPPGTALAAVYCDDEKFMSVKRILSRSGYRVFPLKTKGNTAAEAQTIKLPEYVRAAVAVDCADTVKYYSAMTGLPVYCALSEPSATAFLPSAVLDSNGLRVFRTPSPAAVVVNISDGKCYETGLGLLSAAVTAVFDGYICSLFGRAPFCPQSAAAILGIAEQTALKAAEKNIGEYICTACAKVSAVGALAGDSRYFAGSVFSAAAFLQALAHNEGRTIPSFSQCFVFLPSVLMRFYSGALKPHAGFIAPPDNNLRSEAMETLLGLPPAEAAERISPMMDPSEVRRAAYILRLRRKETDAMYRRCSAAVDSLLHAYRRLAPDGGYSFVDALGADDAALAFALAPEMCGRFTFLTYMKNVGLLDGYLEFVV